LGFEATTTMAAMSCEMFERTLIAVHGREPATTEEWTRYVTDSNAAGLAGVLVVTDAKYGGPTALQRAQANAAAKEHGRYPPIAVVIGSAAHRGIVKLFSWMQKGNVVAYAPTELVAAMRYAGIEPRAQGVALLRLHELARRVDSSWIQRFVTLGSGADSRT
jgi:hypothetical protein